MTGIFNNIKQKVTRYIEVNINLFKIELISKSSRILSYFMFAFFGLFVLFCIILFLGFGLTEVFIDTGMSRVGSFFLTTGIYSLLLIIIVLFRRSIARLFQSAFIDILTEDEDNVDEDDKSINN
jgi:hypothetical protein